LDGITSLPIDKWGKLWAMNNWSLNHLLCKM
jgi:hypothetical protein